MGRLIDADKLKESLGMRGLSIGHGETQSIADIIDSQPTAYDVDKVVDQMGTECLFIMIKRFPEDKCNMYSKGAQEMLKKATSIVKGGGRDE